jgi:hypothetical protein
MPEQTSIQDLRERLDLIEGMIAEGRRSTESWGWTFVLWGVAYYVAIAWSAWSHSALAWPVTMIVSFALTASIAVRRTRRQPATTLGRAIASIWIAVGISMFVLLFALGLQGLLEERIFMGIVAAMLGSVNAASSLILKWKTQFACTLVWWVACAVCVMGTSHQSRITILVAIFLCQIVFGIYAMMLESRRHGQHGAVHA